MIIPINWKERCSQGKVRMLVGMIQCRGGKKDERGKEVENFWNTVLKQV